MDVSKLKVGDYFLIITTKVVEIREIVKYHDNNTCFTKTIWINRPRKEHPEVFLSVTNTKSYFPCNKLLMKFLMSSGEKEI